MVAEDKRKCCGCGACLAVCPYGCIHMDTDEEGFSYPHKDVEHCVNCGLCDRVCPMQDTSTASLDMPLFYVLYHQEEAKREMGSSGGVFGALSEETLQNGNVVAGIAMDRSGCSASFQTAERMEKAQKLFGSKYLQADIGRAYTQLTELVENGQGVLVSGTPCQIAAMQRFPGLSSDRITYVDVVCHGVPSPKAFGKYVKEKEEQVKSKVTGVAFRNKNCGWRNFSLQFSFSNKMEVLQSHRTDPYMQLFLRDQILRPSCYECPFRSVKRTTDLTLADCWGVRGLCQDMDDDKGLSLVLVHTKRGKDLIQELLKKEKLTGRELPPERVLIANPSLTRQPVLREDRRECFAAMDRLSTMELAERYARCSLTEQLREKMNNVRRRLRAIF